MRYIIVKIIIVHNAVIIYKGCSQTTKAWLSISEIHLGLLARMRLGCCRDTYYHMCVRLSRHEEKVF